MADFRLRNIPEDMWADFKSAALERNQYPNEYILELVEKVARSWRKNESDRILKKADEIRQGKLLN